MDEVPATMHQYISFDIGTRNMAYCIVTHDGTRSRITHWDNVDVKGRTIKDTTARMLALLDDIAYSQCDFALPTTVLVENQPSKVAQVIRTLQVYIVSYFDIVSMYHGRTDVVTRTISPHCKLQLTDVQPVAPTGGSRKAKQQCRRKKYQANKKAAVAAVQELLESGRVDADDSVKHIFTASKKKDDLADCLLQALSVL